MKRLLLNTEGLPLIVLSHRKQEFIGRTMWSLRNNGTGISEVVVVDDSGDAEHHQWLDDHGFQFSLSDSRGRNVGYLQSMNVVWQAGRRLAEEHGVDYVMLWEEDFQLTRPVDLRDIETVMRSHPSVAQLNLQRQAVYPIERRLGYMESHQYRRYRVRNRETEGLPWVSRHRPFTTNPGMIRREVLDIDWPTRAEANDVKGGAEPAMSIRLEDRGWFFGWYGPWNTPFTRHMGTEMKTGKGY